jgi:hypothetical protein
MDLYFKYKLNTPVSFDLYDDKMIKKCNVVLGEREIVFSEHEFGSEVYFIKFTDGLSAGCYEGFLEKP